MKNKHTVTVKNISNETRIVRGISAKEEVKKGQTFETTPDTAKELLTMYPKYFIAISENMGGGDKSPELAQSNYKKLQEEILPALSCLIAPADLELLLNEFNDLVRIAIDDEHPEFCLAHFYNEEGLEDVTNNGEPAEVLPPKNKK